MRKPCLKTAAMVLLLACGTAQARDITDMAGRKVKVPDTIHSIYNAGPYMTVASYLLAPELLSSLSLPLDKHAEPYLMPGIAKLPVLGSTMGQGRQVNPESLLAQKPDVALAWSAPYTDNTRTEEMFQHVGIPLVYVNLDTMADYPAAMRFMGQLLGREKRGNDFADYMSQALARVKAAVGTMPEAQKVKVYYAQSADGLARNLFAAEIPIGIVTELLGIPVFIIVLRRVRKGWAA